MKNSKLIVSAAVVVIAILGTGGASAADLPMKAPPMVAAPVPFSWTGFYVGGNVGYGWHDRSVTFSPNDIIADLGVGTAPPISFRTAGGLGGVQLGYNWQFNRNWLIGFETDFALSDINGRGTSTFATVSNSFTQSADERIKWFGTVRGRLGYIFANSLLAYATGGFAYGRVEQNLQFDKNNPGGFEFVNSGFSIGCYALTPCYAGSSARTATGWTAGGGFEYSLLDRWTIKAEYLFVDLGSNNISETATRLSRQAAPGTLPSSFTAHFSDSFHVVRIGLNYSFGNNSIVARY
jgi:outer membrane immunogenic protein